MSIFTSSDLVDAHEGVSQALQECSTTPLTVKDISLPEDKQVVCERLES
jgi:hypothetical protein